MIGDERAREEFVQRHISMIFSLCIRNGLAAQEAEDVAQDVFLDLLRGLPQYRGESSLSTWVFAVAWRRLADHHRSPDRRYVPYGTPGDEGFPDLGASLRPNPEDEAILKAEQERVLAALARLNAPTRSVLIAYYLGEMTVAEILRTFRLPEGTVKTHLHRGRQALRKELYD